MITNYKIVKYLPHIIDNEDIHLSGRIKEVIELSLSAESKLQYFQMFCMFKDFKGNKVFSLHVRKKKLTEMLFFIKYDIFNKI